ncbi:MAG: efflux RND transporter periplasmic adaptor subunit [Myxococcaceae bacterium]|nr:efflux RND transporter periplasmic adaptor subunit [Myxococcaceae bacterium]
MSRLWSVVVASLLAAACGKEGAAQAAPGGKPGARPGGAPGAMAFPVEVHAAQARDVQYSVRASGSVEAFERVQVTARVAGVVEQVRFREGQAVEKGQPLADIDPARYQLAVRAAQASLDKAKAASEDARAQLERREGALKDNPGLIPGEEVSSVRMRAATAAAELAAAQVALDQAKLNQRDASLRAPMSGVMQTRTVQTGQYVQPGTVLGTLLRRDPLLLRFSVAEAEAPRLQVGSTARFTVPSEGLVSEARIILVAGAAEDASRMVRVTAEVTGEGQEKLRPGAFAEVTVPVGGGGQAVVVPQTAVRPSAKGFLAYVVDGDTAHERVLQLGMRTEDGLVEVRSGLVAGERLVVRGAEALREGATVRVVTAPAAGTGPGPATKRMAP